MINVTLWNDDESKVIGFDAVGHAGTAERGKDLVCAAASILAYTLIDSLVALEKHDDDLPIISADEGNTHILIAFLTRYEDAVTILATVERGYRLLARDYPDAVSVKRG